jgi:hypothetical protein
LICKKTNYKSFVHFIRKNVIITMFICHENWSANFLQQLHLMTNLVSRYWFQIQLLNCKKREFLVYYDFQMSHRKKSNVGVYWSCTLFIFYVNLNNAYNRYTITNHLKFVT